MTRALALLLLTGCSPLVVQFDDKAVGDDTGPDDTLVSGAISVSPASADLGVIFLGATGEAVFGVQNVGDGPVALTVEIGGASAASWSYTLVNAAPEPGVTEDLVLTLTPSAWGDHAASVIVRDTAGSGGEVTLALAALVQEDADGDGFGSLASGGDDCDDADDKAYPGAPDEWYDGVDSDCAGDDDFDQDGDGVQLEGDCDDTNATIYPGAPDAWYDGVDSDCAGNDDFDQDADGVQTGADCDDTDPNRRPGAPDEWYDGIDSDCAGNDDYDQDGDGVQLASDCNDTNPNVYPGAPETWYDGIDSDCAGDDDFDQDADGVDYPTDCDDTDASVGGPVAESWNGLDDDCDGTVDEISVTTASSGALYGSTSSLALGSRGTLALGGDLDGDGTEDLIAVSSAVSGGQGWLVTGASAVGASGAIGNYDRAAFSGTSYYGLAYVQGPMQDLTGDATDDVLIGAVSSYVGAAILLDGDSATSSISLYDTYSAYFAGDSTYDLVRWGVGGDIDGDGVGEVVTGAVLDNNGYDYYTGNIAVFSSSNFSGAYDLSDSEDQIHGEDGYDYLGTAVAIGDVTGDGYGDILAGASGNDSGASNGGAVYVFAGNASLGWSDIADDAAYTSIVGTTGSMALGSEAIPTPDDLDGDSVADVAIAASASGQVWAFFDIAGTPGEVAVTTADANWTGTASSFATSLAIGDIDDDGVADLAIGASGDDTAASNAGAVYFFLGGGAWTTAMTSASADGSIYGAASGDALGSGLAAGGDLDDDGSDDMLLGANGVDTAASGGGAVYVLLGR